MVDNLGVQVITDPLGGDNEVLQFLNAGVQGPEGPGTLDQVPPLALDEGTDEYETSLGRELEGGERFYVRFGSVNTTQSPTLENSSGTRGPLPLRQPNGRIATRRIQPSIYRVWLDTVNDRYLADITPATEPVQQISSNYDARVSELLFADTSGGSFTITLPTAQLDPTDAISIIDAAGSWSQNPLTVDASGNTIDGKDRLILDTANRPIELRPLSNGRWIYAVR